MKLFCGTSGFSYDAWHGAFYPESLGADERLRFYSARLSAVEINNTFMRMPSPEVLSRWASETPPGFRFALKAHRKITHMLRLKEGSGETAAELARRAASLGEKLGPVLFQLPPNFKADAGRLSGFLSALRDDMRAAFEFRHPSWFAEETYALLREHGAALCIAEDEELATPFVATTSWGYLRLRRVDYDERRIAELAEAIGRAGWTEAFAFFKHEDGAQGPAFAARLVEAYKG